MVTPEQYIKIQGLVQKNPATAPPNLKQVQNMKNAVKKEERPGQNRTNTADDVQSIINMIHDSPIIQEIIQGKGKPPSVILYTDT